MKIQRKGKFSFLVAIFLMIQVGCFAGSKSPPQEVFNYWVIEAAQERKDLSQPIGWYSLPLGEQKEYDENVKNYKAKDKYSFNEFITIDKAHFEGSNFIDTRKIKKEVLAAVLRRRMKMINSFCRTLRSTNHYEVFYTQDSGPFKYLDCIQGVMLHMMLKSKDMRMIPEIRAFYEKESKLQGSPGRHAYMRAFMFLKALDSGFDNSPKQE